MVLASLAILPVLLQSPAAAQPPREPLPAQFVLRNEAMKQHASVVGNGAETHSG